MLKLKQEGDTIWIMFNCEACGKELPIKDCAKFSVQTDLMMLCKRCDKMYREAIKSRNPSAN